jgi:sigma-E factor negative regulatory protein RseB
MRGLLGQVLLVLCSLSWATANAGVLEKVEALKVLERASTAADKINYSGAYIHQYGEQISNFQIVHVYEGNESAERREALDGQAREYIRIGSNVRMYPAVEQGASLDRRYTSKLFPNHLPENLPALLVSYRLNKLGQDRVAGRDATIYQFEPVDHYRYPQRFWVDNDSGLILKSLMLGMRQEIVQSFAFSQIQLGGSIDRRALKAVHPVKNVVVNQGEGIVAAPVEADWRIKSPIAGFRLLKQTTRNLPKKNRSVIHHLYSDGVVTVSVFIEPMNTVLPLGLAHQGAVHLYTRQAGAYMITCLGEVPAATVEAFANAYTPR